MGRRQTAKFCGLLINTNKKPLSNCPFALIMEKLLLNTPNFLEKHFQSIKIILSGLLLFGSGLLIAKALDYQRRPSLQYQENTELDTSQTVKKTLKAEPERIIKVDISGSVVNPGVYSLNQGDRVEDALKSAGGLSSEADKAWVAREVNLAAKVSDGTKIYIPAQDEVNQVEATSLKRTSSAETAGAVSESGSCPAKININTASLETLQCLYNVGEARAQAIIDYRSQKPFDSIEEITSIKGIGEKTLERIRERIVVR